MKNQTFKRICENCGKGLNTPCFSGSVGASYTVTCRHCKMVTKFTIIEATEALQGWNGVDIYQELQG